MELFDIPGYFNCLVVGFLVGLTLGAYAMDIANAKDEEEQEEAALQATLNRLYGPQPTADADTPTSYTFKVKHGYTIHPCNNMPIKEKSS